MAKQTINIGASPNDGTGTPLRTAFDYTNQNFTELYTATGPSGNNIVVPGSATITGDLTVDTSTLKVDSTNNRVGIGTASPVATLHVSSAGSVHTNQRTGGNGCFTQYVDPVSSNYVGTDSGNFRVANNSAQDLLNIQQLGVFSFGDGAGGTRMTLNATGLGVGGSPVAASKLTVVGGNILLSNAYYLSSRNAANTTSINLIGRNASDEVIIDADGYGTKIGAGSALQIVSSGNVGIGVTPSAWSNSGNIDLANGFIGISSSGTYGGAIANNAYYNAGWKYKSANYANLYLTAAGEHKWLNAPVGAAAGTAITFTQAMTLDASGNLILLSSNTPATLTTNGQLTVNATSNTNLRFSYRGSDGVTRVANITLA